MTKDEALKMAIEVLDLNVDCVSESKWKEAINACKEALEPEPMTTTDVITCKMVGKCCMTGEALEQPAQEPVAWLSTNSKANEVIKTHQWQELTDGEINKIYDQVKWDITLQDIVIDFSRAIEQELKTKNGFSVLKDKNT
jgi:hypothetical protein